MVSGIILFEWTLVTSDTLELPDNSLILTLFFVLRDVL